MKTCPNDKKVVETVYPSTDYVEQYDDYGKRVFLTLKPNHSQGLTITRVIQCEGCQTERAKPDVQLRLKNAQEIENIATEADTMRANNKLAKALGLSVTLGVTCTQCHNVVEKNNKSSLCATCYKAYRKEYKRDYMREFMREKRGSTHVD